MHAEQLEDHSFAEICAGTSASWRHGGGTGL